MLRVLHVVGKMDKGGLETFVMNILRHNKSNSIDYGVLCTIPGVGDYEDEVRNCGASIYHIGKTFQAHKGKLRFLSQYLEYRRWFRSHMFSVIHIHGSHAFDNLIAVKAALDSGCKRVICHSHTNDGLHKRLNALSAIYLRSLPIVRLACSKQAGEWLYGQSSCFEVIKNGIDVERFTFLDSLRTDYRQLLGISQGVNVIAHTGRLVDVKNQSFLLDIMKILLTNTPGGWILLLIGAGENEEKLRKKACSLGVASQVQFLGLRDDISAILAASDVYVMPSIHEGLPLAAVEAQANGLPTLISTGMSPETRLLSSTRVLDLSFGPTAWAREVASLVSAGQASNRQVAAGHVRDAGFDISATAQRLREIYSNLDGSNY